MKRIKKIFELVIILIFVLSIKSFGFSIEDKIEEVENTNEYKKWLELSDEEKKNVVIPKMYDINSDKTSYSSRSDKLKMSLSVSKFMATNYSSYQLSIPSNVRVKDQKSTGLCWALATNSVIESNIEKTTGIQSPIFSARYVEYATAKNFLDGQNINAYNRNIGGGGFAEIALGLYTSGKGPILEEDMHFEDNEDMINLADLPNATVQKQIKDYVRFPSICKKYNNGNVIYENQYGDAYTSDEVANIRNEIKEHIVTYGAIVSQTYGVGGINADAKKYYSNQEEVKKSEAYFCNNPSVLADHQITIIGWDDTYEISNFNENYRPSSPGAYIVLNSWGEEFGKNGIYYISYEDCFIEKDILGMISTTNIGYDKIYQHDPYGNNYIVGIHGDIYGANVFERDENSTNEWLKEISISSLVDIKCDIYVNPTDGELEQTKFKKVASNLNLKDGYHTIELQEDIHLTGDKFAIVVKYIANNTGITYLGLEYPDNYYWKNAKAELGQSYISTDFNEWNDMMNMPNSVSIPNQANLCIKAFSKYKDEQNKFFSINNYSTNGKYIMNILPKTKINEFINNISTNMEYYICDKNNNKISNEGEEIVKTGMGLENGMDSYKMVVKGDVNGDGEIDITDVVKVNLHTIKKSNLQNEYFQAGDINGDSIIDITDLVKINLIQLKKIIL